MRKLLYLLIILIISLLLPQFSFGIGQMTKPIIIEDVLRGQEFVETVILFNSGEKEETYGLIAEGEIKDWATFYNIEDKNFDNPITEILTPAKSHQDVLVKFTIPEDAANGKYRGQIIVYSMPEKETQTEEVSAAVAQRIGRDVSISITDKQIIELETAIIPLTYDIDKNEPLEIKIIYDNQGNVVLKPDVQLKIIKSGAVIFNAIFPYPENENPIKPRERKIMEPISWSSLGQEDGNYRAEIKILLNGQAVDEDDFRFTIGYKQGWILAAVSFIGFGSLVVGWFVLAGILAVLVGALIFFINLKTSKIFQKGFINLFSFINNNNGKRRNVPGKKCLKLRNRKAK